MKIVLRVLGLLLLAGVMTPAMAAVEPGDTAPKFTATASLDGEDFTFSLEEALAKGPVVVYFFPSAFTQGCDIEAHTFATHMEEFAEAGATVIGVSGDSLERLHAFSSNPDFCAGKFPVASDPKGKIARRYGLTVQKSPEGLTGVRGKAVDHVLFPRVTFVINQEGIVVARLSSSGDDLSPAQHVTKSLAIVSRLTGKS